MAFKIEIPKDNILGIKTETEVLGFGLPGYSMVKSVDVEGRLLHIVGSDETRDRDGDVITVKGWIIENYLKNPVFLWAHNYSSVPLAAAQKVLKKRSPWRLEFIHRFPAAGVNPFADMILSLYNELIINAGSVGFIPYTWEPIEEKEGERQGFSNRRYTSHELLEHSGCAVPSNPAALQLAYKAFSASDDKSFKKMKKEAFEDIINGRKVIEFSDKCRERILGEINEIKAKGVEMEEETVALQVQVPDDINLESVSSETVKETVSMFSKQKEKDEIDMPSFEYLLHHIVIDGRDESIHHCFVYDHIANLFEQGHIVIKDGKSFIDGKKAKDGIYHFIKGLEATQDVSWGDDQAEEQKIIPKKMFAGMSFSKKAKEW